MRIRSAGFLVILLGLGIGCTSTQERYERGVDLERRGRYAEAARYYIDVLEAEPEWEDARVRLEEVGARAVEAYLADAEDAERLARYGEALDHLDRLDHLYDDAESVGVFLALPDDYESYRQGLVEDALAAFLREGEQAEQEGNWSGALSAYERAARYAWTTDQQADFTRRQAYVHLQWGEYDLSRDAYRSAFDRAQHAIELLGPNHTLSRQAYDLQETALREGTHYIAFLPFWRTEEVLRTAPDELIEDLNDVLSTRYWPEPPPFVAVAEPVEVRRELRRLRYDRIIITRTQAAEIGRVVDADYVVFGEVTQFERTERNLREEVRDARRKGRPSTTGIPANQDTSYVEQRFTLDLEAEVTYRILDPRTRRVVDQGTVETDVSGRVRRGVYAGDYRDLDLSGAELSLFEEEERLATQELENDLVDALAERLAERLYTRLLERIP